MSRINLPEVRNATLALFPPLEAAIADIVLATYRRIADGTPAPAREIAERSNRPLEEVQTFVDDAIGTYRDDAGSVIGFWGLSIPTMNHRVRIDGRTLHAWCAWDTLFLPEVLGRTLEVESECPVTKAPIRLTVAPERVLSVSGPEVLLSFVTPDATRFEENILQNFCHRVYFFRDRNAAERWTAEAPGTFVLSLDEGMELGLAKNAQQFGDRLTRVETSGTRVPT